MIASRVAAVRERIARAADRAGRRSNEITLVAVSKTFPADRVREAYQAGIRDFGENRVQEAEGKIAALADLRGDLRWHLVGHLQSNKARRAVHLFDVIQSVDSPALARRLDAIASERGRTLPVYLEVNVDADPGKAGFEPAALAARLPELAELPALRLLGLMTVGRLVHEAEAARPTFRRLRALGDELRARDSRLGPGLSMGMSDDFEVAVEEGATLVRIGRALFGERRARAGAAARSRERPDPSIYSAGWASSWSSSSGSSSSPCTSSSSAGC